MNSINRNEINENTETINDVIFRLNGNWITVFNTLGENIRCKIDFCPWCGKDIRGKEEHTC